MSSSATGLSARNRHVLSASRPDHEAPKQEFRLRPMTLADCSTLAIHTGDAYLEGPVRKFIVPHAEKYRSDYERTLKQSIRKRLFDLQSISVVAYEASNPKYPVGFAQYTRLGDDEGARAVLSRHSLWDRICCFVLAWFFWGYDKVENWLWPDRSTDVDAMKAFFASGAGDTEKYWSSHPERKNRWHVQSVVIGPAYQGKGIGRLLVTEAVNRAQEERVIMGLSSSVAGSHLYRKLGFELLGDFTMRIGDEVGNGMMIRYPEAANG
ncbi:hypothetical protein VTL71DRAFT_942 [Oculimacula yallundae]|uniref:N-acetyltransferase domain-containing protein n=1 Tax=Oculimacula yallundae TaxID=86028 RepID=A0ABR4D1G3_9HELO